MTISRSLASIIAVAGIASVSVAQNVLLIPNSTTETAILVSPVDGSIINPAFIVAPPNAWSTARGSVRVNDEIWIVDQAGTDSIFRYDLTGASVGQYNGAWDNVRGMRVIGNEVWLCNAGTANGAPGPAIVRLDFSGTVLGFFTVGDPFDLLPYNDGTTDGILIANIAGDDIDFYDLSGVFQYKFHNSDGVTGIDFPQQLANRAAGGVWCAGFSPPDGVYAYDSTGAQVGAPLITAGARGVYELANGNIISTNGSNIFITDPATGSQSAVLAGNWNFISPIDLTPSTCYADCDGNGTLNVFDYICFGNAYTSQQSYADCDGNGAFNIFDYICFGQAYSAGCP